uniref:NADH-plastoquinone oxidoreductase subunit 4 n=1 Tax=Enhalus acoroides TaxID=55455 RepID=A0A7G7YG89_9LILI|nr:NADH-plastoquinone oxidoreductase subunit 4 [Enhalus acoroides]
MEFLPHAHSIFSPWFVIVETIQIIYAASTSFGQRNCKKRIAYSSVYHMSLRMIGIGSITNAGLNGAVLQLISHGLIGAALFFLGGTGCDRTHLVYLDEMGGVSIPMPKLFTLFSSFSMTSLALPGMSGFVAESVVFYPVQLFMPKKSTHYFCNGNWNDNFCNGNWNDIHSYLFIIYATPNVLWIQILSYPKVLFCGFWTTRTICFHFYLFARNSNWYLSRFCFFSIN